MVKRSFLLLKLTLGVTLLAGLSISTPGTAAGSSFFAGKTMRVVAGFSPGGSIDLRSRLFARYLPRYIPGHPKAIVQNITGAGGIIAANYTYAVAKGDGLTILHFPSSTIMNTFLRAGKVQYDIRKMPIIWVQSDSWVAVFNPKTSKVKTVADLSRTPVVLAAGGSGVTSLRSLRPKVALVLLGVKHKWVTGYRGSAGLMAAMDRGEIHVSEHPLAAYNALIKPREENGTAAILWQTGNLQPNGSFKRSPLLPNVPTLAEILPKEKKKGRVWEAWKAAVAPQTFQSSVALPPNVPADRLAILSKAFEAMTRDKAYQRDFQKTLNQPANALIGDDAARVVKDGLKRLFEGYKEGIEYLKNLPKRSR
ncbi:MAG: Bug family tripartite tricarboxylate transporter substrate binding protein [Candidatus Binatia bacterium]